jgi:hypothetical protein
MRVTHSRPTLLLPILLSAPQLSAGGETDDAIGPDVPSAPPLGLSWPERPTGLEASFRGLSALDATTAVLMTAGQPARIYRATNDGSVALVHESPYSDAFFDGLTFWSPRRGLAFSDPVAVGRRGLAERR